MLRVYLLEECYWRFENGDHVAEVDEVKVIAVEPLVFYIVDHEPGMSVQIPCVYMTTYLTFGGTQDGCIGLKSNPKTSALGNFSPTTPVSPCSYHIYSTYHQ